MVPPKITEANSWNLSASDVKLLAIMVRNMESKPTFDNEAIASDYGFANASTASARTNQIMIKLRNIAEGNLGPKPEGSSSTATKPAKSPKTPKTPKATKAKKHPKDGGKETPSKKRKVEGVSNLDNEEATVKKEDVQEKEDVQASVAYKKEDDDEEPKLPAVDDFNQAA